MSVCWFNGEIMPADQAKVSVFDHGLLYGDGVFEGIRFYRGRGFRVQEHLQRLLDSARAINLTMPYSLAQLSDAVQATITAYGQPDGYLRLVSTRGEGRLGIDPRSCARGNTFIIADQLTMLPADKVAQGVRVIFAATRRLPSDGLDARVKSLNYLNHILARMEATNAGADEALLLNHQGKVTEGSSDNVFIVKNGRLMTPPPCDGALAGVTRNAVVQLARELGIDCAEVSLTPYDIYAADECFLTGTAVELIPVREVEGRLLAQCPGPVYRRLQEAFTALVNS